VRLADVVAAAQDYARPILQEVRDGEIELEEIRQSLAVIRQAHLAAQTYAQGLEEKLAALQAELDTCRETYRLSVENANRAWAEVKQLDAHARDVEVKLAALQAECDTLRNRAGKALDLLKRGKDAWTRSTAGAANALEGIPTSFDPDLTALRAAVATLDADRQVAYEKLRNAAYDFAVPDRFQVDRTYLFAHQPDLTALRAQKDTAYQERDRLVWVLSKLWPAHLARHPDSDPAWENDWRWIVCIHSPVGQLAWHIHDSERDWFEHLEVQENDWDGHTTKEKYDRLLGVKPPPSLTTLRAAVAAVPLESMRYLMQRLMREGYAGETLDRLLAVLDAARALTQGEP